MDRLYKEMISKQSMAAEAQTQRCQGYSPLNQMFSLFNKLMDNCLITLCRMNSCEGGFYQ